MAVDGAVGVVWGVGGAANESHQRVRENYLGWASLKVLAGAIIPPDGEYPKLEVRCLTVGPRDQLVCTLSPAIRGIDPDHVAASVEGQQVIRLHEFGQGILN